MNVEELDRILNDALGSYTLAEPRAGFTARTIARVGRDAAEPRRKWLNFAAAGLALACLVAAVVTWRSGEPGQAAPVPVQTAKRVSGEPVARGVERSRAMRRASRATALTAEERALVAFARRAPDAARQLAQPDKPLEIEAMRVRALEIEDLEVDDLETGAMQ